MLTIKIKGVIVYCWKKNTTELKIRTGQVCLEFRINILKTFLRLYFPVIKYLIRFHKSWISITVLLVVCLANQSDGTNIILITVISVIMK